MDQMQVQKPSPSAPGTQTMVSEPVEPKKGGGWLKWAVIVLAALIIVGGLGYWIFL